MSGHLELPVLSLYSEGRLSDSASLSIEAHFLDCPTCRSLASQTTDPRRREEIWTGVTEALQQPRTTERVLALFGIPEHLSRLLVMTPSVRGSWFLSMLAVLAMSAVVAPNMFGGGPLLFLILAPLVPVIGIAVCFGPPLDPVREIGLASPTGGFRLTLIRASAVLVASIGVVFVPATFIQDLRVMVVWLLPGLILTVLTLLASTVMLPAWSAVTVSMLWVSTVSFIELASVTPLATFQSGVQVWMAGLAGVLVVILGFRRPAFDQVQVGD
jgi:hypothetical protein